MQFDAGKWGMVEVDEIIRQEDCVIGVQNPNDVYHRVTYWNYGKAGCSRVMSVPAQKNTPETVRRCQEQMTQVCFQIARYLRQKADCE